MYRNKKQERKASNAASACREQSRASPAVPPTGLSGAGLLFGAG